MVYKGPDDSLFQNDFCSRMSLDKKEQMTPCLRRMVFGQLGTDEFLLAGGLESWICNYLEQLDEIPDVIEGVVVVVQVLLQGAGHCYDRPTE